MLGEVGKRYRLLSELGQGGMGVVYKAQDRLQHQIVALKQVTVRSEFLQFGHRQEADLSLEPSIALAREFRTLASLRHPHIISVLDYGFDELHRPYFTMEYLENPSTFYEAAETLDVEQRLELTIQMLHALAYLHRRRLIHRDLKPENVLVVSDNGLQVKVLDFGVANDMQSGNSFEGIVGTLAYIAPEIFQGMPPSVASDLYAVGVMLYELFHGKHPFEARLASDLLQLVLNVLPEVNLPNVHPELSLSIERLLLKDPQERYTDAYDLIDLYATILDKTELAENHTIRESFLQAAKFVGRDEELELLQSALKRIFDDNPQGSAWLIGGESGVGKSRLAEELRTIALVEGAMVLKGESVAGGGLPYQLWRDVARRLVLSTPDISATEASILKEIVPDIADLIGREVTNPDTLIGDAVVERLSLTLVDLLRRQDKPIVLILSDLHWSRTSLNVLKPVLNAVKDLPLLVLGSYRNDEQPELAQTLVEMQLISLQRLSTKSIEALSNAMLGKDTPIDVVNFIQRHSEGNAFFIIEIVRALSDHAGQFNAIGHLTLPESILTGGIDLIIQQRLERVGMRYRDALKLAAVAGRAVDPSILSIAVGDNFDEAFFQICADAAVLEMHEEHWRFTHSKLRESLLSSLSDEEEQMMNAQIALAIEAVYPDDLAWAHILSLHWLSAKDKNKAAHYGLIAAKQLANTSTYNEATILLQDVLRLIDAEDTFALQRMEMYTDLGMYYEHLSLYDTARINFSHCLDLARKHHNDDFIARGLNGFGVLAYNQTDYATAHRYLNQSLEIAAKNDDSQLMALSLKHRSNVYSMEGAYQQSDTDLHAALLINRREKFHVEAAGCLNNLGVNAYLRGDYKGAQSYYTQALEIYTSVGYRSGIALCESNLGDVSFEDGDEVQLAHYQRGLKIYREVNNQWGIALCLDNMGSTLLVIQQFDEARACLEESISISRAIGDQYSEMYSIGNLGLLYYVQGEYQQSVDICQESLALAETIKENDALAAISTQQATSQLALGLVATAQENLRRAYQFAEPSEGKPTYLTVLVGIAHLYRAKDRLIEMQELVRFLLTQDELEDTIRRIFLLPLAENITIVDCSASQTLEDIWQTHRLNLFS